MTKTISVKTEFAFQIVYGVKDVENRTWNTNYRGRLLIHSSGKDSPWPDYRLLPDEFVSSFEAAENCEAMTDPEYRYNCLMEDCSKHLILPKNIDPKNWIKTLKEKTNDNGCFMRSHCIIGEVELVDVVKDSDSVFAEPGQFHWILDNPIAYQKPFTGVPGKLRLWDFRLTAQPKAVIF